MKLIHVELLSSLLFSTACFAERAGDVKGYEMDQDAALFPTRNLPVLQSVKALEDDARLPTPFFKSLVQQKEKLRPVTEERKNLYAKFLSARRDPYNREADLSSFIKKLRIDEGFLIDNDNDAPAQFKIKLESKAQPGFYNTKTITLAPGEVFIVEQDNNRVLSSVKVISDQTDRYLNPKFTLDGHLQLRLQQEEDRCFFHQSHDFNFRTMKYTDTDLTNVLFNAEEHQFRQDFNGSFEYMTYMAEQEGMEFQAMLQQRQDLYEKNKIFSLLKKNPDLLDGGETKIPLVTHKIWVTSDDAPKDPSPQYIKWLENSIEHNKTEEGWTHIFWIENKAKLPNLVKLLENHPSIKLMELDALDKETFITKDTYKKAIADKKFGKATDIIRLELLRQYGGFYLDTDYELFQSLKVHAKAYDMIMGLEPMSVYLCNAFIGARPDHPVIDKALEMVNRNLSDQAPDYIKNVNNNGFKTIIETGPAMVTAAFGLAAGEDDNVDIVLSPQAIYPAYTDVYPKKQVVVPNGKIPAQAFGAHYWNTAWMDPQFGSKG